MKAEEPAECVGSDALRIDVVQRDSNGSLLSGFRFSVEFVGENKADTDGIRRQ